MRPSATRLFAARYERMIMFVALVDRHLRGVRCEQQDGRVVEPLRGFGTLGWPEYCNRWHQGTP